MKLSKKNNKHVLKLKKTYKKQIINKKNYKGGTKLIGEGAYGCVISPAIKCGDCKSGEFCDSIDLTKNVSKILSLDKANEEYVKYENLNLGEIIPESTKYFIEPVIQCSPPVVFAENKIINGSKNKIDIDKCLSKLGTHRSMIIYNNGGMTLEQLLQKIKKSGNTNLNRNRNTNLNRNTNQEGIILNSNEVFRGLKNVLEGILKLGDNDIVHFDIKSENIVIGDDLTNLNFKIIDFGVSKKFKKTFNSHNDFYPIFETQHYFIHPPYSIFLSGRISFDADFDFFKGVLSDFFNFPFKETYSTQFQLQQLRKYYDETYNKSNTEGVIAQLLKGSSDLHTVIDNLAKVIIPDISQSVFNKTDIDYYDNVRDHILRIIVKIFDIYSFGVLLLYCSSFFPESYNRIKEFLNETKILSPNIYEAAKSRENLLENYDRLITDLSKINPK
jgi:serine/threonine protein kinase